VERRSGNLIGVLIVEDSAVVRELLRHTLESDPGLRVVGTACNGVEALRMVERVAPDVITMDIHMPGIGGFDVTRRIMETRPTPIVIVSGTPNVAERVMAFRAVEAGALAVLPTPVGVGHPEYEENAAELIRTVKLMSEVKVVRRWRARGAAGGAALCPPAREAREAREAVKFPVEMVAIGASTGGPMALQSIVSGLPPDFRAPILVVQHIATGFADGFAGWLGQSSSLPVQLGTHNTPILPGNIYIAPDGHHMQAGPGGRLVLSREAPENGLRPSVGCLFRSVAKVYGRRSAGVLLSGMGKDGAPELKLMKDHGAVTIAQDRESSVIHGMPGEAIRLGGTTWVLPPEKIATALATLVSAERREMSTDGTA